MPVEEIIEEVTSDDDDHYECTQHLLKLIERELKDPRSKRRYEEYAGWYIANNLPYPTYEEYLVNLDKKQKKERQYVFLTIQDFKTRISDLENLKLFIDDIKHLYDDGHWVIETGSREGEEANLHIHMLVRIGKHVKNHKRDINVAWKRYFSTDLYDKDYYFMKQWRKSKKMPSYEAWLQEKKEYFVNDLKSEDHRNSTDLECFGTF